MSKDGTSASRVKAFRSRLTGQFKRVEAYVTEEEKRQIEAVKATLGVTTDVAVAGLVRLGLEQYQKEASAVRAVSSVNGTGMRSMALSAWESVGACASPSAGLSQDAAPLQLAQVCAHNTSGPVLQAKAPAVQEQETVTNAASREVNPIARFFQNRKEYSS